MISILCNLRCFYFQPWSWQLNRAIILLLPGIRQFYSWHYYELKTLNYFYNHWCYDKNPLQMNNLKMAEFQIGPDQTALFGTSTLFLLLEIKLQHDIYDWMPLILIIPLLTSQTGNDILWGRWVWRSYIFHIIYLTNILFSLISLHRFSTSFPHMFSFQLKL